jgi:hypothetical protein
VFLTFAAGSYTTYSKTFRDSSYYLPSFVALSLVSGWLWVVASRRLDSTSNILMFSMVWDLMMVIAYYAGPLVFKGESFNWQAYAAAGVMATGMVWFKVATS